MISLYPQCSELGVFIVATINVEFFNTRLCSGYLTNDFDRGFTEAKPVAKDDAQITQTQGNLVPVVAGTSAFFASSPLSRRK